MTEARAVPEPRERPTVRKVTPRQVKAAQIAVKGYQRRGREVPPGLQRIAEAKRLS